MTTMQQSERARDLLENAIELLMEAGWDPIKIREEVEYIIDYVEAES